MDERTIALALFLSFCYTSLNSHILFATEILGGRFMKKQTLHFQKLLCFHYKYKLLIVDILCIILAIIFSCIFYEYKAVASRQCLVEICENALYEYIENPLDYAPPEHVIISLEKNTISAAIPDAFIEIIAQQDVNGNYHFTKEARFEAFVAYSIYALFLYSILFYAILELLLYLTILLTKKLFVFSKKFKENFVKKFSKFKNNLERKWEKKCYKDYEDSRLKEIYQLGYNMGHADGLAEGSKNSYDSLNSNFPQ